MVNYDLTPEGSSTPKVRLYSDAFRYPIVRKQRNQTSELGISNQGTPSTEYESLKPGDILIRGDFLGADAKTLAIARLRDGIFDDESVETVDLQGVNNSGNNVSAPFNGTYTLLDKSRVEQLTSIKATDGINAYRYRIMLSEG